MEYTAYDIQLLKRLCEDRLTETGIVINTWDVLDNRSAAQLVSLGYASVKEEWRNMWGEVYGGVVLATDAGRNLLKSLNKEAHETYKSTMDAVALVLEREERSRAIEYQRDTEGAYNEGYAAGQESRSAETIIEREETEVGPVLRVKGREAGVLILPHEIDLHGMMSIGRAALPDFIALMQACLAVYDEEDAS